MPSPCRRSSARTVLLLAALTACKISVGGTGGTGGNNAVSRVTILPSVATLGVGESVPAVATAYDAGGNVLTTAHITWASTNGAVAIVSQNGNNDAVITGVAGGTTTITARSDGVIGSSTITTASVTFASVSVGITFVCGLTTTGAAYCWGDNVIGQLGTGAADTFPHATPEPVSGGHTFTALLAGGTGHACGLVAGGAMYCWGGNSYGELGLGAPDSLAHPTPTVVSGSHAFGSFTVDGPYTCALDTMGAAWCWGDGFYGELGSASRQAATPTAVGGGLTFAGIAGGTFHLCAATSTGATYCWGRNNAGQLGIGAVDSASHTVPAAVLGGIAFNGGAGGANYSCGLSGTTGYCWGSNAQGVLGTGISGRDSVPTAITGGIAWKALSAGHHTCGVSTANVAYCWGDNSVGELGIGSVDTLGHNHPLAVSGGLSFTSISVNRSLTSCGIATTGRIYCWGDNARGELGNGTVVPAAAPVRVLGQP